MNKVNIDLRADLYVSMLLWGKSHEDFFLEDTIGEDRAFYRRSYRYYLFEALIN